MSFLSRLFGSRSPSGAQPVVAEDQTTGQIDYKGFVVRAVPFKKDGQFQTAGIIEKEIGGVMKTYRFVRADRSSMVEDVTQLALLKGPLIIDEMGDRLFD